MDRVITLNRQFGSGGRALARILGEMLDVPVYDSEIVKKAAELSGIAPEHFEKSDEKRNSSFLFSLVSAHYGPAAPMEISNVINDDNLFFHTAAAIKSLASKPCVVVGRCSDDVLKDLAPFRIFVCAETMERAARIAKAQDISEKEALSIVKKSDKSRSNFYNFYTGKDWSSPLNYDLVINTGRISLDKAAKIIISALKA